MAIQAQAYQDNLLGFPVCGNSQDFFMANGDGSGVNGCGGSDFNAQQLLRKQLQQQFIMQQQQQRNHQSLYLDSTRVSGVGDKRFAPVMYQPQSQSIPALIDQHDREIDQYLRMQNERLRVALQEQRKRQMAELLKRAESRSQMLIAQKDQEIAQASQKAAELQDLLVKLEMESEAWRRVAQENEAMVSSLNNTLDELRRDRACSTSGPLESCCEVGNRGAIRSSDDQEGIGENIVPAGGVARTGEVAALASCRGCGARAANVLFLPCRHLSACGTCAAVLDFCPVCNTAKKACMEALI
ncbi:hypothetical protein CRG98_027139 [Punica granatum]|uniref:BOI-related E3 ubiquitin-protein ligase 3 n=1 Tax=Punica granatum TaxID=22663 RepID=A0A2I0J883_PUNGR|nr:hypothetical protein CRG98_027139 [Punica granatum]